MEFQDRILKCVDSLASVELLLHGEVPGREVIHPALEYNPALFGAVYTDLLHGRASAQSLETALGRIREYLHAHVRDLFGPIFSYLEEEGELRSMSEIDHHFERHFNLEGMEFACEWLADEGLIQKLAQPVRLTEKSRVDLEEAAFYYAGEERR